MPKITLDVEDAVWQEIARRAVGASVGAADYAARILGESVEPSDPQSVSEWIRWVRENTPRTPVSDEAFCRDAAY